MASVEECEKAFHTLAERLAAADGSARKHASLDRTLSCSLPDLDVIFAGRLHDGTLSDIRRVEDAGAQVKLTMSSDDLLQIVDGKTKFTSAWASGRVKVDARVFDLLRLRSVF
jgi:putative sterol carrier protein